jgi:hypothetical protein
MKNKLITLLVLTSNFAWGQQFEGDLYDYLSANRNTSYVSLNVNIKTSKIRGILMEEFSKNNLSGETSELGYLLHADESITIEKVERILVTPAREAYNEIQRIPRTITKTVKVGTKTVECLLRPDKWLKKKKKKSCIEDVFKTVVETVVDEVEVRIPAVAAIYQDILVPFIQLNQSIVPIKGKFSYNVKVDNINLVFEGNKYSIEGIFDAGVRTHIYLDWLPQSITPRGNFNTPFKLKVVQNGYIEINQDGTIAVSEPTTEFSFVEALGSDFVVNVIELGSHTIPPGNYLLELIGKEIDKKLNKVVKDEIEKNTSKINLKTNAEKIINEFDKPITLNDNGRFYPNVTGVFISQLSGTKVNNANVLNVKFGITFQPFATFQNNQVVLPAKDSIIQFSTEINEGNKISVSLPVFLDYDFIANQTLPFIDKFNEKNKDKFLIKKYTIGNPVASFSQNGNVKLNVDLYKRKSGKKIGESFLDARFYAVEMDTSICSSVSNIKIKSSNLLIWLGRPLIKKTIRKESEKNGCKKLSKEVLTASKELDDKMKISTPFGEIQGETRSLGVTDIMAFEKYMILKINLLGDLKFIEN